MQFISHVAVLAAVGAAPALAQDLPPSNGSIPIYDITPRIVPVPTATPTLAPEPTPTATRTPSPTRTEAVRAPAVRPSPTPTPSAAAAPRQRPTATPTPDAAPDSAPVPAATPAAEPLPAPVATDDGAPGDPVAAPVPAPATEPAPPSESPGWPWLIAIVAVLGLAGWLFRRRRASREDAAVAAPVVAPVAPADEPLAVAEASAGRRADPHAAPVIEEATLAPADTNEVAAVVAASDPPPVLEFSLLPLSVGTTATDAVLDFELTVVNPATVAVSEVRISTLLLSANPHQDTQIAEFLSAEISPAIPPFPVAPGEGRRLQATMTLPKQGINVVTARDRPFFVPMMAIDVRYRWADGRMSRTSVAFVVGPILNTGKLAPVFLDRGDRMLDRLEARLHGEVVRS